MALTKDQQAAKLKAIDAKIAKVEQAVKDVEQLRAEREWIASAPIVAPKVRKPRAKKTVVETAPDAA